MTEEEGDLRIGAALRRTSAVDAVRVRFALAIELGLLAPGERLPTLEQAALGLDVAAITVRRALALLVSDGYVVSRRGRNGGTFVAEDPPRGIVAEAESYRDDTARVRALIDERAVSESGLAHWSARRGDAERIGQLRVLVDAMSTAEDWTAFHTLDARFHHVLAEAAGLPGAAAAHARAAAELYAYFLPYPIVYLHRSNLEHLALVEALEAGDAERAADLAGEHVLELHSSMYIGLA